MEFVKENCGGHICPDMPHIHSPPHFIQIFINIPVLKFQESDRSSLDSNFAFVKYRRPFFEVSCVGIGKPHFERTAPNAKILPGKISVKSGSREEDR